MANYKIRKDLTCKEYSAEGIRTLYRIEALKIYRNTR